MTTIMITILPDGMPVDKMEETEQGYTCPLPSQDPDANMENMDMAEYEHNYREADTDEYCGICANYNQTDEIMNCIETDSGDLGYCQVLKFVCSTEYVCDIWASGGPITSEAQEEYKDIL